MYSQLGSALLFLFCTLAEPATASKKLTKKECSLQEFLSVGLSIHLGWPHIDWHFIRYAVGSRLIQPCPHLPCILKAHSKAFAIE